MQLENAHVVVIGGSSGIGEGVARACVTVGARVTLVGRSADRLAAARDRLPDPVRVETVRADVTQEEDVARLFAQGPVDHVVLTAVDAGYAPVRQLDVRVARRTVDSKLLGALLVAKHADFRRGGSLTLTGGIAETRAAPGGSVVAAVNGAISALGRALAVELAPVRVNVVSPGWIDTPIWEQLAGDDKASLFERHARRLPVGRMGDPDDVAQAALFLMTNGFVTAEVLHVDGGHRWV